MATRWIWSETAGYEQLGSSATLDLLRRFGVRPLIAVQPKHIRAVRRLGSTLRDAGIEFGLWPMLEDSAGRWASAANMLDFLAYCDRVLDAAAGALPSTLAFDLEPSIDWVRPLTGGALPRIGIGNEGSYGAARSSLISYVVALHARGLKTLAAAVPLVLHQPDGQPLWERALGTPVLGVGFEHVSVMAYPSLLEGWSRGMLRRHHAQALLSTWARRAAAAGVGISLGAVGVGAFGNEPQYRSPLELAGDVELVRGLGVESIALLDLGGVLRRPPAEAWLAALVDTPPSPTVANPSRRVRALVATLDAVARILG